MRSSRPTISLAILLFLSAIGADDCVLTQIGKPVTPSTPPASTKPLCYTDPPQGCAVLCTDPSQPPVANGCCSNPAAGPLAQQFLAVVQSYETQAEQMTGMTLCGANSSAIVTPCGANITPVLFLNQDPEVCMVPPPGCTVGCQ